ncbi:MAG: hypothetical protein WCG75_02335 [Armatimonadota bacterium]
MKVQNKTLLLVGIATAIGMVGCSDPNKLIDPKDPVAGKQTKEYIPTAAAGVQKDITKSQDPSRYLPYISRTASYGHRQNPFALNADEAAFDRQQAAEKIIIDGGQIGEMYQLPPDTLPQVEPVEPQPYRRLSGILIGDSVLAILEQGNTSTIVRPGQMLPGTDWKVISIDQNRAILHRTGSNRAPREVEVRLEIGFPSQSPAPGGGNNGTPNNTPPGGGNKGGSANGGAAGAN